MKHKSKTFEKFKEFQSEVENQLNKKIKHLRSDRGGEYLSFEFGTHLNSCGIAPQLTPARTPVTSQSCYEMVLCVVVMTFMHENFEEDLNLN